MDRVRLAPDLTLSRMAWGLWRLADPGADTAPDAVRARIEAALEAGMTTLDQADIYGGYEAEAVLGRALTPELRDRLEIVTKCGIVAPLGRHAQARVKHYDTSRAHVEAAIDTSLRGMGIERIDLLLIHRPDPLMDAAETGAALDDAVRSGKLRAVGASNFRPHDWTLLQSAMATPLVTNQIELSLACLAPFTDGDLAFLQERRIAPMAWSPLGGGALLADEGPLGRALDRLAADSGTDRAAVALAWLLRHPAGILPVIGSNDPGRIRAAARATAIDMDRETWFELYSLAAGHEVP